MYSRPRRPRPSFDTDSDSDIETKLPSVRDLMFAVEAHQRQLYAIRHDINDRLDSHCNLVFITWLVTFIIVVYMSHFK